MAVAVTFRNFVAPSNFPPLFPTSSSRITKAITRPSARQLCFRPSLLLYLASDGSMILDKGGGRSVDSLYPLTSDSVTGSLSIFPSVLTRIRKRGNDLARVACYFWCYLHSRWRRRRRGGVSIFLENRQPCKRDAGGRN